MAALSKPYHFHFCAIRRPTANETRWVDMVLKIGSELTLLPLFCFPIPLFFISSFQRSSDIIDDEFKPHLQFPILPRPPNPTAIRVSSCHSLSQTSLWSAWTCSIERESEERETPITERRDNEAKLGSWQENAIWHVACDMWLWI